MSNRASLLYWVSKAKEERMAFEHMLALLPT